MGITSPEVFIEVTQRNNKYLSRCVTKTLLLWLLTMVPVCARLDSLEMTLQELSSHPLLEDQDTRVSWSVWDRRMPMLEMRLSPREVSSPLSTPVLPTECRRRSPLLPHPPSRSRSLLHQR